MSKTVREIIQKEVEAKRPSLSPTSVKTYVSILFNLHKKLEPDEESLKIFDNDKKVLDVLNSKPAVTRKTILSALFILTGNGEYQKQMLSDCKDANNLYKQQKKTDKQEENWMSNEELKDIYDNYYNSVNTMLQKKIITDTKLVINYILLGCVSGVSGLPPRRSLDYTDLKINNYDPDTDNYYSKGIFHFNKYKTAKTYGLQTLNVKELAPEFYKILRKWIKINDNDYLLYSSNGNKLTSPQMTRMLHNIFGKKVSIDMIRHIYLTDKYGKINSDMKKMALEMGHPPEEQSLYIKK